MPGSYAHLTLIATMRSRTKELPGNVDASYSYYPHFCDLGAVSPDYPYLVLGDGAAEEWADLMHQQQVVELLNAGVRRLRNLQGAERRKCLSWFLGYASHVVLDMTMHPIIPPYEEDEKAHRVCELHQDAFIFPKLNLGEVGVPEYFDSGIGRCTSKQSPRALHEGVRGLWQGMLQDVHPDKFADNPPDIDHWHRCFLNIMDDIASEGYRLVTWARHLGVKAGVTYPRPEEVDSQHIYGVATPEVSMDYEAVFQRGQQNVLAMWQLIGQQVSGDGEPVLSASAGWNLDTGRQANNELVYWEVA